MARRRKVLGCIFSMILFVMIIGAVGVAIYIGEGMAGNLINKAPDYPKAREIMSGTVDVTGKNYIQYAQNIIGAPYLLYELSPNNEYMGHNRQSYRGELIPFKRTPGVARILFLGGSTTYGFAVLFPDCFPQQIKNILDEKKVAGYDSVEVINGGLPFGTTAEMLTHYHFKYHYFRPDIVVFEAGGNDAQINIGPHYSPDFRHQRKSLENLRPLPPDCRWIMKSNITAYFMLKAYNISGISANWFTPTAQIEAPLAHWFENDDGTTYAYNQPIKDQHLAFLHNMRSMVREAEDDGAKVILVPFVCNPTSQYTPEQLEYMVRHEKLLKELAEERSHPFVPMTAAVVGDSNWQDFCHPTAPGERNKAEMIVPYIQKVLEDPELVQKVRNIEVY